MSQFIDLSDYDASIHSEILDRITRNDTTVIDICEDRAISEMRGYLSARYDVDALFAARGAERNQLTLMMSIDISVYHLFCIHNPKNLSQIRVDRYKRAVEWLKQAGRGDITVDGAPLLPQETLQQNCPFLFSSNKKRVNHL